MRILIILSVGLLINIVYSALTVDSTAFAAFSQFPWICILALGGMLVLPWLTDSIRWLIWLRFNGYRERFAEVFRITLAGEMVSALTPAAIGGTGAKLGWMITRGLAPGVASSILFVQTIEDCVFFALALPVAFIFSPTTRGGISPDKFWHFFQQHDLTGEHGFRLLFLAICVFGLVGWVTWRLLPESLKCRMRELKEKIKQQIGLAKQTLRLMAARGKGRFAVTVMLAGLHWACRFSMLTVLLIGLQQHVDPFKFFASQWLVFMLMKLVPSPGGTGGAEVAFVLFYRSLFPENLIGLLVGSWRVLTFTLPVGLATLLFLIFMRWHGRFEPKFLGLKKSS
jgi:hypothetical protein